MIRKLLELSAEAPLFTICVGETQATYENFKDRTQKLEQVGSESIYTEIGHFREITSRLVLTCHEDNYTLYLQLKADWVGGIQEEVNLNLGLLHQIFSARQGNKSYHFPSGSKIIQAHRYFMLPYCVLDDETGDGVSVWFENSFNENWIAWDQNRGTDLIFTVKSIEDLRNREIVVRPSCAFADVFVFNIKKTTGGFSGFFQNYKAQQRSLLDLSLYDRPELKWYRDAVLPHFTYLFGKEAYDYQTNKINLDQLLADGEEFGGYDSLLLWHQYPRLGLDTRTQWEFFDDFPGGRTAIREIVIEANRRGVKVFLPFKPWDIPTGMDEAQLIESFVTLLKDTGVNGMFFDTMTAIPAGFREAADSVDRSFAFCTEGKPRTVENLERITGSWDQFWNKDCILEINLARYVLPENAAPMISRWHVGMSREKFIKRAIWNGSGLVVWQDVFGAWCPFSDAHKVLIKKWKSILKANTAIYFGKEATPLWQTLHQDIYCNYFSESGSNECIYSLFNNGDSVINAPLVQVARNTIVATELWNGQTVHLIQNDGTLAVQAEIQPKEILIVKCKRD